MKKISYLVSTTLGSRLLRDYIQTKESEMLKEKMAQELHNVRSQSAQFQQEIGSCEARIKELQAGVQRLQGAEMMLSHLLQQEEQAAQAAALQQEAAPAEPDPVEYAPEAPETNVVELKKPKKKASKKKKKETADKT